MLTQTKNTELRTAVENSHVGSTGSTKSEKAVVGTSLKGLKCDDSAESIELSLSAASPDVQDSVNSILAAAGVQRPILVYRGTSEDVIERGATQADVGGKRVIVYSSEFLKVLIKRTRNTWGVVSVLAHEVGHIVNSHNESSQSTELEADYFSGFMMRRLGASLEDALCVVRLEDSEESRTYPSTERRITEITRGYNSTRR
jgi:hypothetical protein